MTEVEWLACTDPTPMLDFLRGKSSDRKYRLFAAACYRSPGVWPCLRGFKWLKAMVWEVEQAIDGQRPLPGDSQSITLNDPDASRAASLSSRRALHFAAGRGFEELNLEWADGNIVEASNRQFEQESVYQCDLLRCVFGNLFPPSPSVSPAVLAWNDATVCRIAEGIYEKRAFDRLPILADALLDAGCDDDELLSHCRSEGPHIRGCWAVDLILGRA